MNLKEKTIEELRSLKGKINAELKERSLGSRLTTKQRSAYMSCKSKGKKRCIWDWEKKKPVFLGLAFKDNISK